MDVSSIGTMEMRDSPEMQDSAIKPPTTQPKAEEQDQLADPQDAQDEGEEGEEEDEEMLEQGKPREDVQQGRAKVLE